MGNRLTQTACLGSGCTPATTTYTYDNANRLATVNGATYTYDANGNLTADGARTYAYDAAAAAAASSPDSPLKEER